jgi:hypothetical protein
MAGLLTLKPLVTTPIWLAILSSRIQPLALQTGLSILPGLSLSVLALLVFRPLFSGRSAGAARSLLALDCLRWINSAVIAALSSGNGYSAAAGSLVCLFALLGLALPTIFAVTALAIALPPAEEARV